MVFLILALGSYLVYPLFLILLNSFNVGRIGQPAVYSLQAWADAWSSPGLLQSLRNTFAVAFWYQAIAFPVGVVLAWALARTNVPWARGWEFMFWLSFFLPSLATILGWILLLDPRVGLVNQAMGGLGLSFNIYSFWGIVWVHLMSHAVSSTVMLLTPAFRNMDAALEEASWISGATNWRTALRITLPIMTPPLVIVFMLALVRLFESFEIELLLGVPFGFYVYSTKIVDLVREHPPELAQATALGSITLVLLMFAAPVQRWLTTRREYVTVSGRMRSSPIQIGRWRWAVFGLFALVAVLLVLVPLVSVLLASFMTRFGFFDLPRPWTLANWQRAFADPVFGRSLTNTLLLGGAAAIVGPLLLCGVAYVVVRARSVRGRGLLDLLLWIPSVIPGALAGLGLLWMFLGVPFLNPLYGTIFLLVIASIMSGITLATQVLKASLLQLGRELEDASRMSGASWPITYVHIVLPILAPTLVVVGTLKFLFAANATSSIILLATSETRPLSLLTLDYVREGLRESAAVTSLIIASLTTALALIARRFGLNLGLRN
jgi:iron(III) transport system permease protein